MNHGEIHKIIDTFNNRTTENGFCISVSYKDIEEKKLSFSAGQYFDVVIDYLEISPDEFATKMREFAANLDKYFTESNALECEIKERLRKLQYEI